MLNRLLIVWIIYAGIVGFALGGSFVSAYFVYPTEHGGAYDSNKKADDEKSKEKTDEALARYTWWLTAFTGGLAFVTGALCIATVGLYVTGEKQIEVALKSANAAELSAKAAIALELPIFRADLNKMGWSDTQNEIGEKRYWVWIDYLHVSNVGRTSAFPIEVECGHTFGEKLPAAPIYTSKKTLATNTIYKPETVSPYDISLIDLEFAVPPNTYDQLRSDSSKLWFYFNLIYLDFLQNRHEAGFCWRRHQGIGPGHFIVDSTSAYNRKT